VARLARIVALVYPSTTLPRGATGGNRLFSMTKTIRPIL